MDFINLFFNKKIIPNKHEHKKSNDLTLIYDNDLKKNTKIVSIHSKKNDITILSSLDEIEKLSLSPLKINDELTINIYNEI
jgi:hypothetical protein